MVLRRHGINYGVDNEFVNPANLNSYLTGEGGYTYPSEKVKWHWISNYSKPYQAVIQCKRL